MRIDWIEWYSLNEEDLSNFKHIIELRKDNNLKIEVVGVSTFDDAINYLNNLN